MRFTAEQVEQLAKDFEGKTAQQVLEWALEEFGPKIGLASSFGAEDVAIIDMMAQINKDKTHVFTLETGRLNQETYDVMDDIRARYGISITAYFPDQKEVEEMIRARGMNLMYASVENRKLCCEIRKVHPLNRALASLDGWITGLRRDQVATRASTRKIEIDSAHGGIIKLNPIADWTSEMVWDYIKKNNVPYNKLHDMGYPSIGCEPCTRAVEPGEDPRAGRWWWENAAHKECGLHFDPVKMMKKKK
ncbi:phosphoadenylylsulfate reductase (thioredoxin) [Candidatus Nitrososphaera evergladensis SR1]|jgi:phosphoadenosine phosphosulfate reductase|uniref:Adenosine 5'-phosphosulfate reductase n=1 Tax=Candidatus Nitrososphaera evergladensis SR1 TaxID=1459636 RepID=A0A075MU65_9ARCH|nr:phosphoadenylyl-sulfate reductase [Candidatus Nitrososphaera evergladensis]AIF84705.1 phosphoadenylylsulfate reductase (thioredoxin) [Candidatus Nitrososphaera evergladensis SR1]